MAKTNGHKPSPSEPDAAALLTRLQQLAAELAVSSIPRVSEMTNALEIHSNRARLGDGQSKEILRRYFKALEDAQAAVSSIEVVRRG